MDLVIHGLTIYFSLLIIFKLSGKRTLQDVTTFDFVLMLIIAGTIHLILAGSNASLISSFILVLTLLFIDTSLSLLRKHSKSAERVPSNAPAVLIDNGKLLKDRIEKACIDEEDILEAARKLQGLESMSQIKYAILEEDGSISITPKNNIGTAVNLPSKRG